MLTLAWHDTDERRARHGASTRRTTGTVRSELSVASRIGHVPARGKSPRESCEGELVACGLRHEHPSAATQDATTHASPSGTHCLVECQRRGLGLRASDLRELRPANPGEVSHSGHVRPRRPGSASQACHANVNQGILRLHGTWSERRSQGPNASRSSDLFSSNGGYHHRPSPSLRMTHSWSPVSSISARHVPIA